MSEIIKRHFDEVAGNYDQWKEKAHYYYATLKALLREVVEENASVCEVGCGTGDILASLRPSRGVGLDISPEMVRLAAVKHPSLTFRCADIEAVETEERFRYVVAVDVVEHVADLNRAFSAMAGLLEKGGILVITTANPRWSRVLHTAERLGLKMPEGVHQWRSKQDLAEAARAAGIVEHSFVRSFIIPKEIPLLKSLNTAAGLDRLRQRIGLIQRATYTKR